MLIELKWVLFVIFTIVFAIGFCKNFFANKGGGDYNFGGCAEAAYAAMFLIGYLAFIIVWLVIYYV